MPLSRSSLSRIASKLAFTCTAVGVRLKRAGWQRQTTHTAPATTVRRQHAQTKHGPRSGARARRGAAGGEPRATARGRCTIILGGTTRTKPRAGPRCPAPRFGRRAPCPARASARARHARSQPNPAPGAGRGTRISSRDHDALAGLELGRLRLERHIRAPGRHACCLLLATEEHVVPKRIHSFP